MGLIRQAHDRSLEEAQEEHRQEMARLGTEMLLVGGLAAAAACGIGLLISRIV